MVAPALQLICLLTTLVATISSSICHENLVAMEVEGKGRPGESGAISKLGGWKELTDEDVPVRHPLRLVFAVKNANLQELEAIFWNVSDPQSDGYGQYLTLDQVTNLTQPRQENLASMLTWLQTCIKPTLVRLLTPGGGFVEVKLTARQAELALGCELVWFAYLDNRVVRCKMASYSLPTSIARVIDYVQGAGKPPSIKKRERPTTTSGVSAGTTPDSLRSKYGVGTTRVQNEKTTQATAQFYTGKGENNYSPSDLSAFFRDYSPKDVNRSVAKVVGKNDDQHPGKEGNLDIQYLMAIGSGAVTTWWGAGDKEFADWAVDVLNTPNAPLVHSVSYDDFEDTLSADFTRRGDIEFMKAGVRGISILFASGDFGTGCNSSVLPARFAPEWPPTSPYVTTIGGTTDIASDSDSETTWPMSGGGFSFFAPRPSYQDKAVTEYLKTTHGLPSASLYNASNRGFPDVAAFATDFNIIFTGEAATVTGTSASTPTWAGLVSLLNDLRLTHGKPPLGFLNPFLYQNSNALRDITTGSNDGTSCFGSEGFPAQKGWDPATGLGVPDFTKLVLAALRQ